MIEAAIGAFGGGSIITAILTIIIKMWDRKKESDERAHILRGEVNDQYIRALDATAYRTNSWHGNFIRGTLAFVPQFIMVALLYIGYQDPDVVIWYGQQQEPDTYTFLYGFIELEKQHEITWRQFNGIVIIPALFAQMGAVNTYYLIGGMFSRR